jgi:hypothetical protein
VSTALTGDTTPTILLQLDDAELRLDASGDSSRAPSDQPISIPFHTAPDAGFRIAVFTDTATPAGFAEEVSGSPGLYAFTFSDELADGHHFISARVQIIDPAEPQQSGYGPRSDSVELIVDSTAPVVSFGEDGSLDDGLDPSSDSGVVSAPLLAQGTELEKGGNCSPTCT